MDNNDHVGFARIERQDPERSAEAQVVQLIYPIKGGFGPVRMRSGEADGTRIVTNSMDRFDAEEERILFVALRDTPAGAIFTECTIALIGQVGEGPLLAALRALDRQRN